MSLIKFLKEKEDRINMVIKEMSLRIDSDQDILNNISKNLEHLKYITEQGNFIENVQLTNDKIDVYSYGKHSTETSLGFVGDSYVAALVDFRREPDAIQIIFTNLFRPYRRLMDKIFIEYLLPKYRNIYSDNIQSISAFNFWQRLVDEKNLHSVKYKVFIVDDVTKKEIEISNSEEMSTTYGYDTKHINIIYKLQKV